MRVLEARYGKGRFKIWGSLSICKGGSSLVIFGGEKPHIGTAVITVPRPSLKTHTQLSTTSSVINLVGHKDEFIAKKAAEKLAIKLKRVTCVTAGVHIKDASSRELKILIRNADKLTDILLNKAEKIEEEEGKLWT